MADKITYGREEGGFAVYVNGKKQSVFRIKGWMNGLHKIPEFKPGQSVTSRSNKFYQTQFEYHGKHQ